MHLNDTPNQVISGGFAPATGIADDQPADPAAIRLQAILKLADEDEGLLSDEEAAILHRHRRKSNAPESASDHYANLANFLEDRDLNTLANDVITWVRRDDDSREEWVKQEKIGLEFLGITKPKSCPAAFDGGSEVIHPMLAEACTQFWARASAALWPAGSPVKTTIIGKTTDEKTEKARRVEGYMNYLYTVKMENARKQTSKLLFRLPISGNLFTRPYWDDSLDRLERAVITPERFVVPYEADNLETALRYTEIVPMPPNTMRRMMHGGIFRTVELQTPDERTGDGDSARIDIEDDIKRGEGREDVEDGSTPDRHTVYYCTCDLDLAGFEEDIALPYTVAVDRDSSKVLAIYRQWRPSDKQRKRLVEYTQHGFIPGLGFYDYGFYHLMGSLARTATGSMRALLDAGFSENTNGGLKSEDLKIDGGKMSKRMDVWYDVAASGEDMKSGLFPWPKSSPSQTLFNLLGFVVESFNRFAGTTDSLMGEGSSNVPVGTTMARIEQGMMSFTAIQAGLHNSFGREYRRMLELAGLWAEDRYPYAVAGESSEVFREDFDPESIAVLPVSDPNFVSHTQRYFSSLASIELAEKSPELYDMREVHKRAQMTLRIDDLDSLMPEPSDLTARMGPVEENAAALQGIPIKTHMEQDDQAHIVVHSTFLQGLDEDAAKTAGPPLQAHIQAHIAAAYLKMMQQQTGVPYRMPDTETIMDDEWAEMPPEMENQIAMLSAQAAQQMQAQQQQPPPVDPEAAEQSRKDQQAQADIQRKDTVAGADIRRKNAVAAADTQRKTGEAVTDAQRKTAIAMDDAQRKEAESVEAALLKRTEPFPAPPAVE